jgi:hypothetical protein
MLSLRMPLKPRGAHLNGNITIDFSTLAGSLLTGNNGAGSNGDAEDTAVYSVAWGSKIRDGSATATSLTINSGIHSDPVFGKL